MKRLFSSAVGVRRFDWVKYDRRYGEGFGSGYCADSGTKQQLVRQYRVFGAPIWTSILDEEDVPSFVSTGLGCFGSTSWRSKFAGRIK